MIKPEDIPGYIAAIGALGIASYGMVESLGKAICLWRPSELSSRFKINRDLGLPYVGFNEVRKLTRELSAALEVTYGESYEDILRQQYRAGRSKGEAPDTIRQGVRLGLPFLSKAEGTKLIGKVWGLKGAQAEALITALTAEKQTPAANAATPEPSTAPSDLQKLAARFATALDTRVEAVFCLAEEQYEATARLWAAMLAIGMSISYGVWVQNHIEPQSLFTNALVGAIAVPLAPVAKDLASSLTNALGALSKLQSSRKA